ncbi:GNAT family N-acetyltransferase [Streptomyces antimicrobicus]|uniref:GNAT family N-acetyltransferase n=1 Tax=Streptomyces antimicrobicus TaxID=2883108 RepID=A0ABS8BCT8_9ACTN|nr:GNAT family protein [Streptomyces antimicrobicus]MCB5182326.1 GNAT family N-acetyltransferase [Streptomyces antimicrobicus]
MEITYRALRDAEGEDLVDFLVGEVWPFHGVAVVRPEQVRRWIADGVFGGERNRTFWVLGGGGGDAGGGGDGQDGVGSGGGAVGLVRLMDLGDGTPMLDLRVRSAWRGRGIGRQALEWATRYLFEEFPEVRRIEGTTRQDNVAMRRTFLRCGYVKEAHYRDGWPGEGGAVHDAVGYAVLRRDWEAGSVSLPEWDDGHLLDG